MKPFTAFLRALAGPIVWAAHFFAIYIAEALVCTAASPTSSAMRMTTLLLTLLALLALAAIIVSARQAFADPGKTTEGRDRDFLPAATLSLALISCLAVIWTAAPAFFLPVCAFSPG